MDVRNKLALATRTLAGSLLIIGTLLILVGCFANGYTLMVPIGIGTVTGAGFIFVMGMFMAITDETLARTKVR